MKYLLLERSDTLVPVYFNLIYYI